MPISRRTFLRGTGVTLALPFLEAMVPLQGSTGAPLPKRVAFLYVPNGVGQESWKPAAEGAGFALPHSLEPLAHVRQDVNVITGLSQIPYAERSGVGHARPTTALLTGAVADREGVRAGKSLDQFIAERIGQQTRLSSLQLGVHPAALNGQCDSGYSCAYSSCISWRDERSPLPPDNSPQRVFQRIFGVRPNNNIPQTEADQQAAIRLSVLDQVLDDARSLQNELGRNDQHKLDEYLYSVRQLEQRVNATPPTLGEGGIPRIRIPDQGPTDYAELVRLLGDLMVLAFQTDVTRVCTFMFGMAASEQRYPALGIREGHHELSHHGNNENKLAKLRKIDRFNVSLYAYILERMRNIREGEATLLDNSLIFYGSGLGNGNAHTPFDLPVLVGGRSGGAIQTGRHIRCRLDTPLNNLWVSVLNATGIPTNEFGNSTGPIRNLAG